MPKPKKTDLEGLREIVQGPKRLMDDLADLLEPPENPQILDWCSQNLPQLYPLPFGPHHRFLAESIQEQPYGLHLFEAASRGSGKTAVAILGIPMASIALGIYTFIVIIAATQEDANNRLRIIRSEIERNESLVIKWPRLRFVKKKNSNKDNVNKENEIQLKGGRIVALGAGASVRGLNREDIYGNVMRPDLIVFDDLESPDQVRSKLRTDRLEDWLFADVGNLGSSAQGSRQMSIVGIGTTIAGGSLAMRALKKMGRFASWVVKSFPAEYKDEKGNRRPTWPEGQPLSYLDRKLDPSCQEFVGPSVYAREFLLDPSEMKGGLWTDEMLEDIEEEIPISDMRRVVIAIDPSWGTKGDECGIIVAGVGWNGVFYVIEDLSQRVSSEEWGRIAATAFYQYKADRILAETAFGADQVKNVMKLVAPQLSFKPIGVHRGKTLRFEPFATSYSRKMVRHFKYFPKLIAQQLDWNEGQSNYSPDRLDAAAIAHHELMLQGGGPATLISPTKVMEKSSLVSSQDPKKKKRRRSQVISVVNYDYKNRVTGR